MDNGTVVIRPIRESDLKSVCEFANQVGIGFTSLVKNPKVMSHRIQEWIHSFKEKTLQPSSRFIFVLEVCEQQEIIGTSAIDTRGKGTLLHNYKMSTITQVSPSLDKYMQHTILELVNDYQNNSELCALFLQRAARGIHRGELLSRSRCLFIAEFPHLFSDIVFAQMRGYFNAEGISPFWEAVGRHFFDINFLEANYLRAVQGEQFIADLMPKHPLYVDLLSKEAQEGIGKTHQDTQPALHLLEREGFSHRAVIDIFEAGPIIEAYQSEIKTVLESKKAKVCSIKNININNDTEYKMVSNTSLDFRVTIGHVETVEGDRINMDEKTAELLNVSIGDSIRYCSLHQTPKKAGHA